MSGQAFTTLVPLLAASVVALTAGLLAPAPAASAATSVPTGADARLAATYSPIVMVCTQPAACDPDGEP